MPKYFVPICVTISAHLEVEADSRAEAIEKQAAFYPGWRKLTQPCVDVDFCVEEEEIEEEVEEDV